MVNNVRASMVLKRIIEAEKTIKSFNKEMVNDLKDGLSPSKKFILICFNESSLKMMKNAFYFILKALFILKIFKFVA